MNEKIIEIPFNRPNFIDSHKAIWDFISKKFIKSHIIYTLIGSAALLLGLMVESNERYPIVIMFAGGYLFYIIASWFGFYERYVKFNNKIKSQADKYGDNEIGCTFTFSENGVEYQDKEKLFKLSWHLFRSPIIVKDNIFLLLKEGTPVSFSLSKKELGDDVFQELYNILKEKLG